MRGFLRPVVFLLLLQPALAQEQALDLKLALANAPLVSEGDWRSITDGGTVVYEINGAVVAYEHYLDENQVVLVRTATNACEYGTWFMQEKTFCFRWEGRPLVCFNHKVLDEDTYVIRLNNGLETNDIQLVAEIIERPLQCGPDLLSALEADTINPNDLTGVL